MNNATSISVIVPVLNEAAHLPASLASVGPLDESLQLIVVDGGSKDDSLTVARRCGAKTLVSPIRQRAAQMNLGADSAKGDVLLFLHADTRLPENWRNVLATEMQRDAACVGGAFRRRFDSPSFFLRTTCRLSDWRGSLFNWFLGDQAIFVRRDVFRTLGGFARLERCEDLDFSIRLARLGKSRLLPLTVVSSARRFEQRGPLRQTLRDFATAISFLGGALIRFPASPTPTSR
jgi:rSAM/selenodomain-associated transferase 2